jgi:extracellular matrix protein 14
MRLGRIFPLLLALSPAALVLAVPSFSTSSSHHPHEQADTVPSFPHYQGQSDQAPLRIWPKLRDTVIEALWGKPNHQRKPSLADKPADQVSSTPSSIRARYGDDIVLRFTITNPSEVEALREASNVLFLDVWASTDKWVDIRLSKDVVRTNSVQCRG